MIGQAMAAGRSPAGRWEIPGLTGSSNVGTLWVHRFRRLLTMKARLVRIGNSRGVRLPKPLIEEAGLSDEVEVRVRDGAVVITSFSRPRTGWAEAARRMGRRGDGILLDQPTPTRFDVEDWRWT